MRDDIGEQVRRIADGHRALRVVTSLVQQYASGRPLMRSAQLVAAQCGAQQRDVRQARGGEERLTMVPLFDNNRIMETKSAVASLAALAQETRLSIFRLLIECGPEGMPAGEIGEQLKVPPATLSFHLKELSHAGLVTSRQEGRFVYYAADFEHMAALMTFLTQNCCKGMPQERLTVVETALGRCCPPSPTKRKTTRSRS